MSGNFEDQLSQYNLITKHYWVQLLARQAMIGGFYTVTAIHFATCYWLLSQGGFLAAMSPAIVIANGLLALVYFLWDKNYHNRLKLISASAIELEKLTTLERGDKLYFHQLIQNQNSENQVNNISRVLIISVSLGCFGCSVALFVFKTLPFINHIQ